MPATPNRRLESWTPPPMISGSRNVNKCDNTVPDSLAELADYILETALLPEIACYDGHPEVQRGIAEEAASRLIQLTITANNQGINKWEDTA